MTQPSRPMSGTILRYDGSAGQTAARDVPVEMPVNIVYGTLPYAVMMATPADLEDFAIGFSLTEGIVANISEIKNIAVEQAGDGIRVAVELSADRFRKHLARRRNLSGRTSCGLCGVEDLDQIPGASRRVSTRDPIAAPSIHRALSQLDEHQPLNQVTHAVHGAAWCAPDGVIVLAREDVGRHNAIDKMIGACVRDDINPSNGFVLITSRCSFEMVEKAAIFGAHTLVAISAPTSLAIDRANALGVNLIAIARADNAMAFTQAPNSHHTKIAS